MRRITGLGGVKKDKEKEWITIETFTNDIWYGKKVSHPRYLPKSAKLQKYGQDKNMNDISLWATYTKKGLKSFIVVKNKNNEYENVW